MKKSAIILWLVVAIPFLAAMVTPAARVDSPTNIVQQTRYRTMQAISCSPFAYVPDDYLKIPIEIKKDIGNIRFQITTSSQEAQQFFHQGMAYLYNFEYVQAARSFYVAQSHDSSAPMIYWGLSQAYESLNDSTESRNFAKRALGLSTLLNTRERQFIEMQHELVQPVNDSIAVAKQRVVLSAMMDSANARFPKDAEMWIFTGLMRAYSKAKGAPGETYALRSRAAIDLYFSKALELDPEHFGAWHYLVHLHEATSEFDKALQYGNRYTGAAPAIPHAWHMYAHDLMKTGQVSKAIEKFNHAFKLELEKYKAENMPAHYDWHHQHNMELLAYCHQYKGQFKKAESIFSKLDTLKAYTPEKEGRIRKGHPFFYLQNNQPAAAIRLAKPLTFSDKPGNRFMGFFITGLGNVFQQDEENAALNHRQALHIVDSLKEAEIKMGMHPEDAEEAFSYLYAQAGIVNMGIGLLKNPYYTSLLQQMESIQSTLLKQTGPDPWIDALYFLQLLTQLSIKTGNLELAERSANNMLKHDPAYPGAYWMLARIYKLQKKDALAGTYLAKAKAGYKEADEQFLASLKFD